MTKLDEATARDLCDKHLAATQDFECALTTYSHETLGFWSFKWNSREAVESHGKQGYRRNLGPILVEKRTRFVTLVPFTPGCGWGLCAPPITWPPEADPSTKAGAMLRVRLGLEATNSVPFDIMEDRTIECPYGWVFFWQSTEFLRTGNRGTMLVGNSPMVVVASTGEVVALGTARAVTDSLAALERERGWQPRT